MISLSDFFNCSVDYLLGCEEKEKAAVSSVENSSDIKKAQLIRNYELLNDEGQQDLVEYSDILAGNLRKIKKYSDTIQLNA